MTPLDLDNWMPVLTCQILLTMVTGLPPPVNCKKSANQLYTWAGPMRSWL